VGGENFLELLFARWSSKMHSVQMAVFKSDEHFHRLKIKIKFHIRQFGSDDLRK